MFHRKNFNFHLVTANFAKSPTVAPLFRMHHTHSPWRAGAQTCILMMGVPGRTPPETQSPTGATAPDNSRARHERSHRHTRVAPCHVICLAHLNRVKRGCVYLASGQSPSFSHFRVSSFQPLNPGRSLKLRKRPQ